MTLALLITAVGGAWAQDPVDGTIAWSVGNEASATVSASIMDAISSTGVTTGSGLTVESGIYFETNMVKYTPKTANAGNVSGVMIEYRIETANGYKFKPTGVDYAAVKVGTDNLSYSWSYTIDGAESAITDVSKDDVLRSNGNNSGTAQLMHSESITADGCSVFTLRFYISNCGTTKNICIGNITISGSVSAAEPDVEVTTNAAEEGATFTEASFAMPAFDATADYELVRDMGIQMTATMGDGTDGVRYRVKKAQQGGGYEPADLNMMQVLALVAVNDGIEQKALTLNQDYFCRIYKLDEQTLQPEGDGVTLYNFDFAPGLYALKAFAKNGSDYDGETAFSNTFELFQGYEVEVAAKEFITYYKDEPLYVEDEAAELYTIESVNGDQAVLSDRSDAMPSNTPMLVYNKSNETKVILLIPCAEPDMAITVAPEFQGTLTGTTIAASTENVTNYAFNGKQFVFVKNAIEVGPNKCWISVPSDISNVKALRIVFGGDATGIRSMDNGQWTMDNWYDLNGRKLNGMPTKRGIYVKNGRKVVVK